MIEMGAVFDRKGRYIHLVVGSSFGAIDDSRQLWDFLWENRETVGGVVHTHPWDGRPVPSQTDVTTFKAIEAGLGTRLIWPIVTLDQVRYFTHHNEEVGYGEVWSIDFRDSPHWWRLVTVLRFLSQNGGKQNG